MNWLLSKGLLKEIPCGINFSYILMDNSLFQATDYKVLHSQTDGGFVKCMKMLYNGHIQLYYMPETQKPLSQLLPNLNAESFLTVLTNLFQNILNAKSNGFLFCGNVEQSFDKIFVDPSTLKVSLVYLPIATHLVDDEIAFETQLRSELVRLIRTSSTLTSPRTYALADCLVDGTLSLEDLLNFIKNGSSSDPVMPAPEPQPAPAAASAKVQQLYLLAMNAPMQVKYRIKKDHFVIGKAGAAVDIGIDFNKMISRVHCCVDRSGARFTVTDLGSTNGTYVNETRLQPNQAHTVKNGDTLRLANSIFQIIIE